jgi:hypothetical protein
MDKVYVGAYETGSICTQSYRKAGLAEVGWQRGLEGLNTNTLAHKLRSNEAQSGLTRHEQAIACGVVLEGGSEIVGH